MRNELIEEIAIEEGLDKETIPLFIKFFSTRFPNEDDRVRSYCAEWIRRFMSRNPEMYMDNESLKVYKLLKGDINVIS